MHQTGKHSLNCCNEVYQETDITLLSSVGSQYKMGAGNIYEMAHRLLYIHLTTQHFPVDLVQAFCAVWYFCNEDKFWMVAAECGQWTSTIITQSLDTAPAVLMGVLLMLANMLDLLFCKFTCYKWKSLLCRWCQRLHLNNPASWMPHEAGDHWQVPKNHSICCFLLQLSLWKCGSLTA